LLITLHEGLPSIQLLCRYASLNSPQHPLYIWQHPDWPQWKFDDQALTVPLAQARQQQGIVIGKAQAIGLENVNLTQVVNDIWVQEVLSAPQTTI
jgi:hypothetical protein